MLPYLKKEKVKCYTHIWRSKIHHSIKSKQNLQKTIQISIHPLTAISISCRAPQRSQLHGRSQIKSPYISLKPPSCPFLLIPHPPIPPIHIPLPGILPLPRHPRIRLLTPPTAQPRPIPPIIPISNHPPHHRPDTNILHIMSVIHAPADGNHQRSQQWTQAQQCFQQIPFHQNLFHPIYYSPTPR